MNEHQRYLIEEFAEDYHARRLGRRDLLRRVLLITGSVPLTASLLTALGCGGGDDDGETPPATAPPGTSATTGSPTTTGPATSTPPPSSSEGVDAREVRFQGPASELKGYLAQPIAASGAGATYPGIVVIHENRGLVEHTRDVARRFAREGFAALAVDLLSRQGGTTANENQNSGRLGGAKPEDLVADLRAYEAYLNERTFIRRGAVGVTGFCFGGGYTWELAIASPTIRVAVPYYGTVRQLDQLKTTKAAILAIYGGKDTRITAQAPVVEQQLKAAGQPYQVKIFPDADHAFFNDTGTRYNAAAATEAWRLTLDWFRQHLA